VRIPQQSSMISCQISQVSIPDVHNKKTNRLNKSLGESMSDFQRNPVIFDKQIRPFKLKQAF